MEIIHLTRNHPCCNNLKASFAVKLTNTKNIWIFNCHEACQHSLSLQNIKISQISKIILTDLNIDNISGLLGLLSSLSLTNRIKILHIYGPIGLNKYIEFGKKYVQTSFRYEVCIHALCTGLIIADNMYRLYIFVDNLQFRAVLIFKEKYGKFLLAKALNFNLISGPIYGYLKRGSNFLLPDGFIVDGYDFADYNDLGNKVAIFMTRYHTRCSIELTIICQFLHYLV